jgi:2-polyprenyl-3-methyl-5-hydroxy-6-metoxy-1,4-benzoquinol methylase
MNLTQVWIPSIYGMEDKLVSGCKVADIGCGHGISTIIMAKAYPNSTFFGFDMHSESIERARALASEEGLGMDRVQFFVSSSTEYENKEFDIITFFACLHDMGVPISAARYALKCLKSDGILMINEPFAHDDMKDNLNTIGRLFYAASTSICIPTSLSQKGPALGGQAGAKKIKEILTSAGFTQFNTTVFGPYSLIFEARP